MFPKEVYAERRQKLKNELNSGIALFMANHEAAFNYPANTYHYRQDSHFSYFFGLNHPGFAGIIDFESGKEILFGDDVEIDDIIWMGPQPSVKDQAEQVGISETNAFAKLESYIKKAREAGRSIHYLPPYRGAMMIAIGRLLNLPAHEVKSNASLSLIKAVVKLKEIKSAVEIAEIEKAVDIAWLMHTTAMKMAKPGIIEQEIAGTIEGIALAHGGPVSFPVILSVDGQTLHNHSHHNRLEAGRMLVVDAGTETQTLYSSDITRTIPVGGKFSSRQKEIYEIVLKANMDSIAAIRPGVEYREMHLIAARTIAEGLKNLGLMKGDVNDAVAAGAHALFFPHGLGHMMGMDVHDLEGLGENHVGYDEETKRSSQFGTAYLRLGKKLKPGFVLTDEPGIYFIPALIDKFRTEGLFKDFVNYDKVEQYKDFGGIRIEDDILVTEDGYRILGKPIPKTVDEVEETAAQKREWLKIPGVF
ncbi:MAG: aminopeptidase P family protein [Bacteroidetes bacterium]|jgi:Xaa-Pro aminopeptidase|nr:aminopeptidase P family protein [Bacteroidota bacterium]